MVEIIDYMSRMHKLKSNTEFVFTKLLNNWIKWYFICDWARMIMYAPTYYTLHNVMFSYEMNMCDANRH